MWYQISIYLLLIAIVAASIYLHIVESRRDAVVLRHTITVNLDILQGEIVALNLFAVQVPQSADRQCALLLLDEAAVSALSARREIDQASNMRLEEILGEVFGAMIKVTEARHLLKAIGI